MKKIFNYSPNFDLKKRKTRQIKFLIFHYTGMKSESGAINRLTNIKSRVSSHYFIKKNGQIVILVPDLYIAWHAGLSFWENYTNLNKYSIGIEISNPGHDYGYKNFSKNQINSILKLSRHIIKKYSIKSKYILGHSDIAPNRKKDPGEKFPWEYLSTKKISIWHDLSKKKLLKIRNIKISSFDKKIFLKNLYKIGYSNFFKQKNKNNNKNKIKLLTIAFQRRYRQAMVNGIIDKECLEISKNLLKKIKNIP